MSIIYKKSLKGVEEVALRSKGLQLRLRAYLILVDGSKSVANIEYLNPGLPEVEMVLAALLDEGYLEVIGHGATSGSATSVSATSVSATSLSALANTTFQTNTSNTTQKAEPFPATTNLHQFSNNLSNSSADNSKFVQARDSMTREIMGLLGKDAEMVVTKIQRCDNAMDLFAMMMGLKKIITMYASAAKAEEFANKFSYISML